MCVCVCVCACVYLHECASACMCVYSHECACLFMHLCMCAHTHICMGPHRPACHMYISILISELISGSELGRPGKKEDPSPCEAHYTRRPGRQQLLYRLHQYAANGVPSCGPGDGQQALQGGHCRHGRGQDHWSCNWTEGRGCCSAGWVLGLAYCWHRFNSPVQRGIFSQSQFSVQTVSLCLYNPRAVACVVCMLKFQRLWQSRTEAAVAFPCMLLLKKIWSSFMFLFVCHVFVLKVPFFHFYLTKNKQKTVEEKN